MVLRCACGGDVVECGGGGELACCSCGRVADEAPAAQTRPFAGAGTVRAAPPCDRGWRLRRLDRSIGRPASRAGPVIESVCRKCGAPEVVRRRAASLYAAAAARGLHRGWGVDPLAASLVMLACRLEGVPRNAKAICEAADVKPGRAHRVYGVVVSGLNISVPPPDPAAYVGHIASACGIPERASRAAAAMLRERGAALSGKNPPTMAAAALYAAARAAGLDVSQQRLADAARVSTTALRARQRDL